MRVNMFHKTLITVLITICVVEGVALINCGKRVNRQPLINSNNQTDSIFGVIDTIHDFKSPNGAVISVGKIPAAGFIPDSRTAIKLAEVIWLPIYGNSIYKEKPFNCTLLNDTTWIVFGTLPKTSVGGTLYIQMNKNDGKILKVTHFK